MRRVTWNQNLTNCHFRTRSCGKTLCSSPDADGAWVSSSHGYGVVVDECGESCEGFVRGLEMQLTDIESVDGLRRRFDLTPGKLPLHV